MNCTKFSCWPIGVFAVLFSIVGTTLAIVFRPEQAVFWAGVGTAAGAGAGTAVAAAMSKRRVQE